MPDEKRIRGKCYSCRVNPIVGGKAGGLRPKYGVKGVAGGEDQLGQKAPLPDGKGAFWRKPYDRAAGIQIDS